MKQKRLIRLLAGIMLVLFAAAVLVGCGGVKKEEKGAAKPEATKAAYRVAMVLTGPINDAGWNESAYKGLLAAKDKFKVDVAYTENVPQPDFESVIRDYADKGYNLVILHGFEFSDVVKAVSPQYPKVTFAVVNGNGFQEPNMLSLRFNTPQTGFLAGAVAGLIFGMDLRRAQLPGDGRRVLFRQGWVRSFLCRRYGNSGSAPRQRTGVEWAKRGQAGGRQDRRYRLFPALLH